MNKNLKRALFETAQFQLTQFRALCITGPRQSGKTTLSKQLFAGKPYVNFETPLVQAAFEADPEGFLRPLQQGAILDEVQRVPDLFRYLQAMLDKQTKRGQFILTGSNHFLLQEQIAQSLAGRVGYLNLLPLSHQELKSSPLSADSLDTYVLKGGYPEIWREGLQANLWLESYIQTYVQRDVRLIKHIQNLSAFTRFIYLCAQNAGQLLNRDTLAKHTGVDSKTIQSWLGLLESSFLVYLLPPWFSNGNKRLVKSPKLYFYDTGLLCALLQITSVAGLKKSPLYGAIFENWVITELRKNKWNNGDHAPFYFFRDALGNEVDLLLPKNDSWLGVEIKATKKWEPAHFKGLDYWQKQHPQSDVVLVTGGGAPAGAKARQNVLPWFELDHL